MVTAVAELKHTPIEVMPGSQDEFVRSRAMFPAYFAGRRAGKSVASTLKMLLYIQEHPGCTGLYTVPTLGLVNRVLLRTLNKHFGYLKGDFWEYRKRDGELVFHTNPESIVFVRPADVPDSIRGLEVSFAAMDEIGIGNQYEAFEIIWPSLTETEDGQLWVTSTPAWEARWIKDTWVDKIDPDTGEPWDTPGDYPVWFSHSLDNSHLPERLRKTIARRSIGNSRWARQEYGGEFISMEGLAFEEFSRDRHVAYPPSGHHFIRTEVGFDYGDSSPTSIHIMRQDARGHIWVTDEYYKRRATEDDWVEWLGSHHVDRVTCDPSLSDETLTYWGRRYGIRFRRSKNRDRKSRRQFWRTQLSQDSISISPDCPNLISELENLAFKKPRGREYETDEWADGAQDHAFDATAYAGAAFEGAWAELPTVEIVRRRW